MLAVAVVLSTTCTVWAQQNRQFTDSGVASPNQEAVRLPVPEEGMTLVELEHYALSSNPSVRRLAALVGAAQGNWVQAGLLPNPSVGYEGQQLGSGGLAEQHGVLFSQEIVRGGKLSLDRAVADRERMRIEQELAVQELRVLTDVRIAFYEVLTAQRQVEVTDRLIRIGDEGVNTVEALFRSKEVGRADVLQAQLEAENAHILAQNAKNRYQAAWQNLAAVVGDPMLPPSSLIGDVLAPPQELDFQNTLQRLQEQSPEITAAAYEVERARLVLERARVEPTPNVTVQGLMNWRDNGIGGRPDGGVAVTVPLPLFNRNQGAIARAEHELIAARQALTETQLGLQSRLAPVYEQYANARNQVERYHEFILPAAKESLDLMQELYRTGETNYTALLTSQRTYFQAHLAYLDAARSLRTTEVEMEGLLLSGSLQPGSTQVTPVGNRTQTNTVPIGGLEMFRR